MTTIFSLEQIKSAIDPAAVIAAIEEGFVLYSQGKVVVPPVGHLLFEEPRGDVHIKYGYIKGDDYYVIKIASGFYDNPKRGLPSSNGSMLVYDQKTGQLLAILLDRGYLTDLRTGAAGAVAAKHLAPSKVTRIGIIGSGIQAHFQLEMLQYVTDCRDVLAWGRTPERLAAYQTHMQALGFNVQIARHVDELAQTCNLIVTTTPATAPLLAAERIRPGTHITAVGADDVGKQELDPRILAQADCVVADSFAQCSQYGETSHALQAGLLAEAAVVELGAVIEGRALGRASDAQLTVADLTGVAIQDIQIAKMAFNHLRGN